MGTMMHLWSKWQATLRIFLIPLLAIILLTAAALTALDQSMTFIGAELARADAASAARLALEQQQGAASRILVVALLLVPGSLALSVWQAQALDHRRWILQLVLDSLPMRIFFKEAKNLTFLGCNRAVANDAGYTSPDSLIGRTDYDMPWAGQAEYYQADDRRIIAANSARLNIEEPQTRGDGSQAWLLTNKIPLRNEAGQVIG